MLTLAPSSAVDGLEEGELSPTLQASSYSTSPSTSATPFASLPSSTSTSSSSARGGLLQVHHASGSRGGAGGGSGSTSTTTSSSSSCRDESPQLQEFKWTDFEIISKVGEGTTGSVYKARHRPSSSSGREALYALKVFRPEPDMGVSISALQEIKSFQRLKSTKHMVRFVGYAFTPEKNEFVLIEEYMEHDLAGLMHSRRRFNEPQIKCIMHQLLTGLDECHRMQLIHRDIKSSNILMHQGHVRITDFGFMTTVENAVRYKSNDVVTLWYRPPEIILGAPSYGLEIDIWSVGCIFFELLTGEIAFRGPSNDTKDQLKLLFKTLGTPSDETWPGVTSLPLWKDKALGLPPYPNTLRERLPRVSPQAFDLISSMLSLDPKKRPTTKQALAHPFFTHGAAPCKPSELPKFQEAHEYELKKAHSLRHGRTTASGGQPRPGNALLPLPSGAVPIQGSGVDSYRRIPVINPHQPNASRGPSRGPPHHQRVPEETRKRPAPDVDWILNREKPSAKPQSRSPSVGTSRTQHEAKRMKTEREASPSQPKVPKRESSVPLATKPAAEEQRTYRRDVKPPAPVKEEPAQAPSTQASASTSNGNGAPTPKAKLIQPLRKASPTRRVPSLPTVPVRRTSETSPPPPAAAPATPAPSSKITIRRSKVGDKPVLRIVTPGGSPPPSPQTTTKTAVTELPPASDAYRESKKRHASAEENHAPEAAAGQRHARKAPRTSSAEDASSRASAGQSARKPRSAERPVPQQQQAAKKPRQQAQAKPRSAHAGELYCTCQQPRDESKWMIACDWCDTWYHGECDGLAEEDTNRIDKYKCRRCRKLAD